MVDTYPMWHLDDLAVGPGRSGHQSVLESRSPGRPSDRSRYTAREPRAGSSLQTQAATAIIMIEVSKGGRRAFNSNVIDSSMSIAWEYPNGHV